MLWVIIFFKLKHVSIVSQTSIGDWYTFHQGHNIDIDRYGYRYKLANRHLPVYMRPKGCW